MAFDTTFTDLRKRRRIPMRLFEERVGIGRSYIHGIEKDNLLPSPEKLDQLASVFVEVAREQEAIDPEEDARRLFRERERTAFVERLGFDPGLAEVLVELRGLDQEQRADIIEPLRDAVGLFETLDQQERQAVKRLLHKVVVYLESLEGIERRKAAVMLAEVAEQALDDYDGDGPDPIASIVPTADLPSSP